MKHYRTLSEATSQLYKRGYTNDFKKSGDQLTCIGTGKNYSPQDLKIVEYHRFEGATNPSDMSIVFAVECYDGTKGSIVSSYGAYAKDGLLEFMNQVKIADRTEAVGPM